MKEGNTSVSKGKAILNKLKKKKTVDLDQLDGSLENLEIQV